MEPPTSHGHFPSMPQVARWSWNVVGIALAAWVALQVMRVVRPVLVPFLVGLLLAALLAPVMRVLPRWLPRHVAGGLVMVGFLGVLVGASWAIGAQLTQGVYDLIDALPGMLGDAEEWIESLGWGIGGDQVESLLHQLQSWMTNNGGEVTGRLLSFGTSAVGLLTATALALVTAFFLLADGAAIWSWLIRFVPRRLQARADHAARGAWESAQAYSRTQVVVAAVDAIGIGLGAWLLGLPFVAPIMLIVFLTAFVPVVGATLSGALAVVVALGSQSLTSAVIMLIVVLLVQQLESNALQPVLMGRAVNVHPLSVILAVALGSYLVGIVGAVLAVPVMAAVARVVERWGEDLSPADEAARPS